ncbi:MAG: N-acetyltransferase, partial [Chitinispirillia bacterium]
MVKYLGTKQLETNRLMLRKFFIDDAENMFKNWANDK